MLPARTDVGLLAHDLDDPALHPGRLLTHLFQDFFSRFASFLRGGHLIVDRIQPPVQDALFFLKFLLLRFRCFAALRDRLLPRTDLGRGSLTGMNLFFQNTQVTFQRLPARAGLFTLGADHVQFQVEFGQALAGLLVGLLQDRRSFLRSVQLTVQIVEIRSRLIEFALIACALDAEIAYIVIFQLFLQLQVLPGFSCLALQRKHLTLQFTDNVIDPRERTLLALELFAGSLAAFTETHDAGSLVEHLAAVVGFTVQDLFDLTLADDRIAFLTDTGVVKQFDDVAHAAGSVVHQVLALAGTINSARHAYFGRTVLQRAVGIIESQTYIGVADGFFILGARKDHVLHARAAQLFRAHLAQDPAHRVRDIAFSAAVRADDAGKAGVKLQFRPSRKGFKSLQLDTFQKHAVTWSLPVPAYEALSLPLPAPRSFSICRCLSRTVSRLSELPRKNVCHDRGRSRKRSHKPASCRAPGPTPEAAIYRRTQRRSFPLLPDAPGRTA